MKVRPLNDQLFVKREPEPLRVSPGGILIPETAQEVPLRGKVVAVGPGKRMPKGWRRPLDVEVGETVMFGRFATDDKIEVDGETLLVMSEADVACVELRS